MKIKTPRNLSCNYSELKGKNIFVSEDGKYVKLRTEEILWISSKGNYAHIHTKEKIFINRISLTNLLKMLSPILFVKIHKCYIVQISFIDFIDKTKNELFIDGKGIPIGRSFKKLFFERINLIA